MPSLLKDTYVHLGESPGDKLRDTQKEIFWCGPADSWVSAAPGQEVHRPPWTERAQRPISGGMRAPQLPLLPLQQSGLSMPGLPPLRRGVRNAQSEGLLW